MWTGVDGVWTPVRGGRYAVAVRGRYAVVRGMSGTYIYWCRKMLFFFFSQGRITTTATMCFYVLLTNVCIVIE